MGINEKIENYLSENKSGATFEKNIKEIVALAGKLAAAAKKKGSKTDTSGDLVMSGDLSMTTKIKEDLKDMIAKL